MTLHASEPRIAPTRIPPPFVTRRLEPQAEALVALPALAPVSPALVGLAALGLDAAAILAAGLCAGFVAPVTPPDGTAAAILAAAALANGAGMAVSGGLEVRSLRDPVRSLPLSIAGWSAICIGLMLLTLSESGPSGLYRPWCAVLFAVGLCTLACGRFAMAALLAVLARSGRLARRAVLVGSGPASDALVRALGRRPDEIVLLGAFDDRTGSGGPIRSSGVTRLGTLDDLPAFARRTRIDLVLSAVPVTGDERGATLLRQVFALPAEVRLAAYQDRLRLRPRRIVLPPACLGAPAPVSRIDWDLLAKHALDRMAGLLLLALALPVMLAIAALLRADGGGAVFERRRFMDFTACPLVTWRFACGSDAGPAHGVRAVLRRCGLDGLPVVAALAAGRLSLVGPASRLDDGTSDTPNRDIADSVLARCGLRPGLIDPATRCASPGPDDERRLAEAEIAYAETRSLAQDSLILAVAAAAALSRAVQRPVAA